MIFSLSYTIGARLSAVLLIMIIGFGIIGVSATVFFGQMEREYDKRQILFDQERHLEQLRSNILTSVVFLDEILFRGNASVIPLLLASNEDTLSSFASFQASAEENELLNDIYLATEYEPVVYRLRNDIYNAVSLFRKGQVKAAKVAREDVVAKRLRIINTFIENSHALWEFDIINQTKQIKSLRNKIVTYSLVIFVLTVSFCFLVLLFARHSITKPLNTLMRAMETYSPENYETEVSFDVSKFGKNEIGVLGRIFEEMTNKLRTYITERKRTEDQIKASLEEKEVLLQEIHHRVKNNLQVISSVLWLQSNAEDNAHTQEVLKDTNRRVMLMAQIHESLHRQDDLNTISASDFLNTLVTATKESSGDLSGHLSFHVDVDDILLDVDHANAYGQIVSELISNSLKHGFPDGQSGTVEVSLHRRAGGKFELAVADDGKGLPEDFDLQQIKTVGLHLVRSLAAKLRGEIKIDGSGGTRIEITFPENPS